MEEYSKDERFAHISRDPRFRSMSKKQKKVKIDSRFQSMFSDKRFKLKYSVDKRGRPINFTTNENLKKYYELSDEEGGDSDEGFANDSSDEEDALISKLKTKSKKLKESSVKHSPANSTKDAKKKSVTHHMAKAANEKAKKLDQKVKKTSEVKNTSVSHLDVHSDDDDHDNDDDVSDDFVESEEESSSDEEVSVKGGNSVPMVGENEPDYARGEGLLESSTDEEEEEEEGPEDEDDFDHNWGELDKNVPEADELSHRLAVCNMDWDRIKAQDLFVLFNSFKPAGGVIKSVRIYPSEFGLQRMKEEEMRGPTELKDLAVPVNDGEDGTLEETEEKEEDTEGNRYHREKLREYQLNRLKYYYGVVECDSVETASKIYDDCDGNEYQASSARLDLRFIPDEMEFENEVKSECTSLPDAASYKVTSFITSALCQSKVNLTWDETDQDRLKLTMKSIDKKGEINEDDFKAYLASSSEDEHPGYGDLIDQSEGEDSDEDVDEDQQIAKYKSLLNEIDESSNRKGEMEMEIQWEPGLKDATEDVVKNKEKNKDQSAWEQYLDRKKEKKRQRREERKKKRLAEKEDGDVTMATEQAFSDDDLPGGVDVKDSFFAEKLSSGTKKEAKKKKKKGKKKVEPTEEELLKKKKEEAELALLMMDEQEDGRQHFSLSDLVEKKKKKKQKGVVEDKGDEDDFKMDLKDSRFDAVFNSHLFNIDPSAPEFKKTKGMESIIQEKLKRRKLDGDSGGGKGKKQKSENIETLGNGNQDDELKPSSEVSLTSLVKSVKAKTEQFHSKKKKKSKQ